MKQQQSFYEVWTNEISDNIQNLAEAYGERICLESALKRVTQAQNPKLKNVLEKIIRLHCITYLKKNLGYYLGNGLISQKAGNGIDADFQQAVRDILPHVNEILESFNYPRAP